MRFSPARKSTSFLGVVQVAGVRWVFGFGKFSIQIRVARSICKTYRRNPHLSMKRETPRNLKMNMMTFNPSGFLFWCVSRGYTALLLWAIFPSLSFAEDSDTPDRLDSPKHEMGRGGEKKKGELQNEFLVKAHQALGLKSLGAGRYQVGCVKFDSQKKQITIPAKVNMRDGFVEYVLVHTNGKVHESVFVTEASFKDIHVAALLLGAKKKKEFGDRSVTGVAMEVSVEWEDTKGVKQSYSILEVLSLADGDRRKDRHGDFPKYTWRYSCSMMGYHRNAAPGHDGSLIALIKDSEAMVNNIWIKNDSKNSSRSGDVGSATIREDGKEQSRSMHGNQKPKKGVLPSKEVPVIIKLSLYQRPQKLQTK